MNWAELGPALWEATGQTLYMVGWSTVLTVAFGLPLGVLLTVTAPGGLLPLPGPRAVLSTLVNIGRSLPFVILMVALIPLTRLLTGTTIGVEATVVPLTVGAAPFFARLAESALREVDRSVVEAALAMGATRRTVVARVLLPEALPALVAALTVTVVTLVSYSAMAGVIGGGGLGDLAIRYGYERFETTVMVVTVALLVLGVQAAQFLGDLLVRRLSRR